ncbi:GntR family transcriptional regulator [Methylobacillus glycogenes]|uniref:GntR family transcriptional regulator n=1 Tax=Methylobacillus glycogenes TaxID=406 RepID=UPI000B1DE260|nr:GntR family transcriptional regulator [Methylobacillus glycogenes]
MNKQAALSQIALDRISAVPVYLQLYQRFREALAQGLLLPGQRVPSIRSLASELKLARGTVEAAYDLLCGEGYFVARGQAGTIVAPLLKVQSLNQQAQPVDTASVVSNMPNLPCPHLCLCSRACLRWMRFRASSGRV